MNKLIRTLGQIFTAVGLTLMAGGIASLLFQKVELRLFGRVVMDDHSRILWVAGFAWMALLGLLMIFLSRKKQPA